MNKLTSNHPTLGERALKLTSFALRGHFPFGPLPDGEPQIVIEARWDYIHFQGDVRPTYGERHYYVNLEEAILDYRKARRRRAKKDRPTNGTYFLRRTWRGQEEKRRWGAGNWEELVDSEYYI